MQSDETPSHDDNLSSGCITKELYIDIVIPDFSL